jgi:hypothetical protein
MSSLYGNFPRGNGEKMPHPIVEIPFFGEISVSTFVLNFFVYDFYLVAQSLSQCAAKCQGKEIDV